MDCARSTSSWVVGGGGISKSVVDLVGKQSVSQPEWGAPSSADAVALLWPGASTMRFTARAATPDTEQRSMSTETTDIWQRQGVILQWFSALQYFEATDVLTIWLKDT